MSFPAFSKVEVPTDKICQSSQETWLRLSRQSLILQKFSIWTYWWKLHATWIFHLYSSALEMFPMKLIMHTDDLTGQLKKKETVSRTRSKTSASHWIWQNLRVLLWQNLRGMQRQFNGFSKLNAQSPIHVPSTSYLDNKSGAHLLYPNHLWY